MALVTIISRDLGLAAVTEAQSRLQERGHTVSLILEGNVTAGNLSGEDVLVTIETSEGLTTLASHLNGYLSSGLGLVIGTTEFAGSPARVIDSIASLMGVVANLQRTTPGNGDFSLAVDFRAQEITDAVDPAETADLPVFSASTSNADSALGKAEVAGSTLLNADGQAVLAAADAGESRIASVGGTFADRVAWLGFAGANLGGLGATLLGVAVEWADGDYESLAFPTTGTQCVRFQSLDLSAAGTYHSSEVTWTEDLPAGTSVTVEAALDGETFSTIASPTDPVPGLSLSDPLTGVVVTFKITLATSNSANTPTFSGLNVLVRGEAAAVTATPTDYFNLGRVKWTSGNNDGLAMELKSYDPSTRLYKLFLPMPQDIAVGDTFEVLPGCDKSLATCIAKFDNAENFQGLPFVPGEDAVLEVPDARD